MIKKTFMIFAIIAVIYLLIDLLDIYKNKYLVILSYLINLFFLIVVIRKK